MLREVCTISLQALSRIGTPPESERYASRWILLAGAAIRPAFAHRPGVLIRVTDQLSSVSTVLSADPVRILADVSAHSGWKCNFVTVSGSLSL